MVILLSYRRIWPPITNRLITPTLMTISQSCLIRPQVSRLLRQLLTLPRLRCHHNPVNLRVLLCTITAPSRLRILMVLMVLGQHLGLPPRRALGPVRHRQHLRCRHYLSRPTSHRHQTLYPIVLSLVSPPLPKPRSRPPPAIHVRPHFLVESPFKAHATHRQQSLLRWLVTALPNQHSHCSFLLLQLKWHNRVQPQRHIVTLARHRLFHR